MHVCVCACAIRYKLPAGFRPFGAACCALLHSLSGLRHVVISNRFVASMGCKSNKPQLMEEKEKNLIHLLRQIKRDNSCDGMYVMLGVEQLHHARLTCTHSLSVNTCHLH
jgi:hypothetical protein